MQRKQLSTVLFVLGFLGIALAIAGIPRQIKEIGFMLVSAAIVAVAIWLRTAAPQPRRRSTRTFAEARPPHHSSLLSQKEENQSRSQERSSPHHEAYQGDAASRTKESAAPSSKVQR